MGLKKASSRSERRHFSLLFQSRQDALLLAELVGNAIKVLLLLVIGGGVMMHRFLSNWTSLVANDVMVPQAYSFA